MTDKKVYHFWNTLVSATKPGEGMVRSPSFGDDNERDIERDIRQLLDKDEE